MVLLSWGQVYTCAGTCPACVRHTSQPHAVKDSALTPHSPLPDVVLYAGPGVVIAPRSP